MPDNPDHYWFIGFDDGTFRFFNDEHEVTEDVYRHHAPASDVGALDAEVRIRRLGATAKPCAGGRV